MNTYPEGNIVTVTSNFKNAAGTLVDPTAVILTVVTPNKVSTNYIYGTDALVTKTGTGIYAADLDTTSKRGTWIYTWWSTGTAQADSGEQEFYVE
jgi:hypothetical protein